MKYFTLSLTLFILLGCSQENSIDESLDLVTEKRAQETLSEKSKKYVGVFGHNTNKELHGKIAVYESENGLYEAEINLVNGEIYLFNSTNSFQKNLIQFKGDKGSFSVDINDANNPIVSNVFIKSKTSGYIKLIKKKKTIIQVVALGTYAETGNEANFYGNWDLIGEVDDGTNLTNQFGPELTPYDITKVIISHRDSENLLEDNFIEEYVDPIGCSRLSELPTIDMTHCDDSLPCLHYLNAHNQTSFFVGHEVQWHIEYDDFST
ncbi:MAG: hypothetical protein KUG68_01955, partial [Flavobacteriaceae bacterium]|nr:hypothetical protein [Flavobacteriaceae bacterium]